MRNFDYLRPTTVAEALAMKAAHGREAAILAGGTDLIVLMRGGRCRPAAVVDPKRVPGLDELRLHGGGLEIGASTTCRGICANAEVALAFAALREAAGVVGGTQIQGRASVVGNLCNASPSADTVPALMAHGARVRVASAEARRELDVADFCTGPGSTVLGPDELVLGLALPAPPPRSGTAFLRFTPRREMDIAVANAATYVELDQECRRVVAARVVIGGVAPTAVRASAVEESLTGRPIDLAALEESARLAGSHAAPIDDVRGTREHRTALVQVLVARALQRSVERAAGKA